MRTPDFRRTGLRLALIAAIAGGAAENAYAGCAKHLKHRTTDQVVMDYYQALDAQDWELVRCHYARNAFIITDGGVLRGRAEIVEGLQALAELFENAAHVINQMTFERRTAMVLYSIDGGVFAIPDGAETFFVYKGRIRWQTSHGFPLFTAPQTPPD